MMDMGDIKQWMMDDMGDVPMMHTMAHFTKPMICACQNPYLYAWVWVYMGTGMGCPGKPQDSL